MTHRNEMTREELNAFKQHKSKISYSQAEQMELLNLVRKFINQNVPSCLACSNNFRDIKTMANEFYNNFHQEIENRLNSTENPESKELIERLEVIKNDGKKGNKK